MAKSGKAGKSGTLLSKNRDHNLMGEFSGFRECHIQSDWLLIYRGELTVSDHRSCL
ncbi:MAG: type II toxin-antitoxin system mRNA interferase toxin, RelE/StbE family [Galactobacillus timonensis]|uniref:type II toxin-antitoxin system mRNA interferase toxin, RelE/StbE family n=1 Tax=Galactobacillus timonensis TaxID=2041840 RepID=UPI002409F3BE|nr:type II toxin-antitoxin system mRNA interferase toxin, RelE/StbE family [Galactobacillus timonensis]MDD5851825.1 type II toxin-antitoxin system mRNA interferase toxin, RelE/StbE family [Galactobacillus timonensis]MDD6598888.1 type II toxin-antitoxin system mRNA interferase toxin, RelE/StbE family [Galactobacillus timonensis]